MTSSKKAAAGSRVAAAVGGTAVRAGVTSTAVKGVGRVLKKGASVINPLEALQTIVESIVEYKKTASEETTKREEIAAWRDVNMGRIEAQRDLIMTYLDQTFDERKANFAKFFEVLDGAIASGQTEVVAAALDSITQLAKSSPFKDIANVEKVRAMLDQPGTVIDL